MSAATMAIAEASQARPPGSSFYAAMRMLPKAEREAMYAIYAFCRAVDDIADDRSGDRADAPSELDSWRADIDALYAGGDPAERRSSPKRCAASACARRISSR